MGNTVEPAAMTKSQARRVTKAIQQTADDLWRLLREAHEGRAWVSLGYESWDAYVRAEFDMTRGNAYRLLAQGEVIAAIEAATPNPDGVSRARATPPIVSARQAVAVKKNPRALPRIVEAVSRGLEPVEAVAAAVAETSPKSEREQGTSTQGREIPTGRPWDGKRAYAALAAVVDELVARQGVGAARSALRDQDDRLKRLTSPSSGEGPPGPSALSQSAPVDCAHSDVDKQPSGVHVCRGCGMVRRGRSGTWRAP